jgi:hypothetical protein
MFADRTINRACAPRHSRRSTVFPPGAAVAAARGGNRVRKTAVLATAAVAVICASAAPAAASKATAATPGLMGGLITSPWASGYAAVPKPGGAPAFTHIQDSFTIPGVDCAKTPNAIAQFRTGIDGISDGTIERVGVSATCSQGTFAGDTAWYQMIPADPSPVVMFSPKPGDLMHASITVGPPGAYTLSLTDLTQPLSFTVTKSCATCHNSSAQVTAGPRGPAPWNPPADFGTVHFHSIVVTDSAGVSGGLADPHWNTDKLAMPSIPHPYTVALALSTVPGPPPHSLFADEWHP